ncbi:MAG: cytochrome c biogenesis protein ResB [Microbacteriaceae bacterium]|nr:cytochrome c biogenesis protein ResB [Microbacteriaceae bacterium]
MGGVDSLNEDRELDAPQASGVKLGLIGWLRWGWRQLTSMKVAIILLLILAIAAIPGSIFPQRSANPNGVIAYFNEQPEMAELLDKLQLFDVYGSFWFSAIYLLLFISLIGCVWVRAIVHFKAMRARPPRTPARLTRMPAYRVIENSSEEASGLTLDIFEKALKRSRYRVERYGNSVSAERGYLRETGNLVFHIALLGVLVGIALGGMFGYTAQRVLVEGQTLVNARGSFDMFKAGRYVNAENLTPFTVTFKQLDVVYEESQINALGKPLDYTAHLTTRIGDTVVEDATVKVNSPLQIGGTQVYLLGNGYAPTITVRNAEGVIVFSESVPFLPQDSNLTSLGVIKITDGLSDQLGMIGFLYPTNQLLSNGALTSVFPDLITPLITLNVYKGDLGINEGVPQNVYALDTAGMTEIAGGDSEVGAIFLIPGETAELPEGMGTISLDAIPRFVSLDVHYDPAIWLVAISTLFVFGGLLASLFIPRRRVWVKFSAQGIELAALARGEDPRLDPALDDLMLKVTELAKK